MIILLGSQKGGCGKSTLSTNISAQLASLGKKTLLIDADRQSTSFRWAIDRSTGSKNYSEIQAYQLLDDVRNDLLDQAKKFDVVVVDAAGRDSKELRTAMIVADILLVPFRPSQPDLDTLGALVEIINEARSFNPNLACKGVLTMVPTNILGKESADSRQYLKEFPEIKVLDTVIHDRKIYRDAISEGAGVVEMNNQKAKHEIEAMVEELLRG